MSSRKAGSSSQMSTVARKPAIVSPWKQILLERPNRTISDRSPYRFAAHYDFDRRRARPGRPWPREESNLRAQLRRLPLYPLSYGAWTVENRPPASTFNGWLGE